MGHHSYLWKKTFTEKSPKKYLLNFTRKFQENFLEKSPEKYPQNDPQK